jgi:predicted GIY-YIG superfamily endonuclease
MAKKDRKPSTEEWFVHMVRCAGGSFYTGVAKDIIRRCQKRNAEISSRYTRGSLPWPEQWMHWKKR